MLTFHNVAYHNIYKGAKNCFDEVDREVEFVRFIRLD